MDFRTSNLKDFGRGSCTQERLHGPVNKDCNDFLESSNPSTFNGMVEVDGELMASYTLHFEL
jgi:hypothetical protein